MVKIELWQHKYYNSTLLSKLYLMSFPVCSLNKIWLT